MKIMTNLDLIARMKELLNEPNYYGSGGGNWSSFLNGGWYVDCTCSIKAILWGGRFISANRAKAHAGCNYGSNNVPDFTPRSCVDWVKATKGNFSNLVAGEILLMAEHGHAGLYIGNGEVIEVTPAWTGGNPGCQISKIGANGERIKNGKQVLSWEYHGKIPVIDYVNLPEQLPTPDLTPTTEVSYTVVKGDTLSAIASRYGTTYQKLAEYNGISNPNLINIGQVIRIPNSSVPTTNEIAYTIKSGDTLSAIASRYGTTWQKIFNDNRSILGGNPNLIYAGQIIKIIK